MADGPEWLGCGDEWVHQPTESTATDLVFNRLGKVTESGGETHTSNAGKFEENFTKKKIPKCSNRKRYVCKSWKEKKWKLLSFRISFFFLTSLHFILFKMFKNLFTYFHVYSFGRDRNSLNNLFLEFFINIINGWSIRSVCLLHCRTHTHTHQSRHLVFPFHNPAQRLGSYSRSLLFEYIKIS